MASCRAIPYEKLDLDLTTARDGKTAEIISGDGLYVRSISDYATLTVKLNDVSADEIPLDESEGFRYIGYPFEKLFFTHAAQSDLSAEIWIMRKGFRLLKGGDFLITNIERVENIESIANMPDITVRGSEGVALEQTVPVAGAWNDPTSHTDGGFWEDETEAYDNDTDTAAEWTASEKSWTSFLTLTRASLRCNKVRFYAYYNVNTINSVDIDVKKDGEWVDVYQGSFSDRAYVEKTFAEGNVTDMRIRFYNTNPTWQATAYLYEVDFWQVPASGGALIVEQLLSSTLLAGEKIVTSSETPEALAASTTVKNSVLIQAKPANTGNVMVGNSSAQNVVLTPDDVIIVVTDDLSNIYIDVAVNGEGVNYIGA